MESLKTLRTISKVRQFYSEFGSSPESTSEESSARFFVFDEPAFSKRSEVSSNTSYGSYSSPLVSPGLGTRNQDIRDAALEAHYKRKIQDLKRVC